ncbi:MAG: hypothetical protein ABI621_08630 [Chloroflexota bacterium]
MKRLILGLLTLVLFGCSSRPEGIQQTEPASLPDLGPAPELTNDTWLNVDSPLRLADLRGKVVIVEMWTFG